MPKLGLIIQLSESHVRDVCVAAGLTETHGGKDLFWFRLWEMQSEGGKGMGAGHLVTMATQALRGWRYHMGGHSVQRRGMGAEPTPPPVTPSLQLRLIFCGSHNPLKWWSHVGTKHSHTRACGTILKETTMKDFRIRRGVCVLGTRNSTSTLARSHTACWSELSVTVPLCRSPQDTPPIPLSLSPLPLSINIHITLQYVCE